MSRTYSLARVLARAATKRRTRRIYFTAWQAGPAHGLVKSQLAKTRGARFIPPPVPGSLEWAHDVLDRFIPSTPDHREIATEIVCKVKPTGRAADIQTVVIPVVEPIGYPEPDTEEGIRATRRRITVILTLDGRKGVPETVQAPPLGSFVIPSVGSVEWAHDVLDGFIQSKQVERSWAQVVVNESKTIQQVRL